jgi:PAS domain S-box-containing protein
MPDVSVKPLDALSILSALPGKHLILLPDAPRFTIAGATDDYLEATYTQRDAITGRGVFEVFPDDLGNIHATGVANLTASLCQVLEQKKLHKMPDQRYDVMNPGTGSFVVKVWRPQNKPVLDSLGNVQYIIHTVEDITGEIRSKEAERAALQKLVESEQNLRNIILRAPVAMDLIRGRSYVMELVNPPMLELLGKTAEEMLDKPVFESMPETRNQGLEQLLQHVFDTGERFEANEYPLQITRNGKKQPIYVNFIYEPIREPDGSVSSLICVAVDVTEQVMARRKIEESREELQLALEIANLGAFRVDLRTNMATYSQRIREWFGLAGEELSLDEIITHVHPEDQSRVKQALDDASVSETHSRHDVTYRVVHPHDHTLRHLRSFGKTLFAEGKPLVMVGAIQDVTVQMLYQQQLRESESGLQQKVLERTLELEALNQELKRSNGRLEEFAYAASHDMKEPIRKIQFFTDRLKKDLEGTLNDEQSHLFGRIGHAATRMSTLIEDLLTYSHVSKGIPHLATIDLNQKVRNVLEDLELEIEEKAAKITVGSLPSIQGHRQQVQQLFQNLVSNALKYARPGIPPEIEISSRAVYGRETPLSLKGPEAEKQYHLIEVKDNGIGFDQQDAERIFHVFTRLHGKAEYPGTGIGLSIVQKVVDNHNGHIWAESEPGKGSSFKILLPVE